MAYVDFGTFLAFLIVPFVSLLFLGKIKTWGLSGYILFLGIGILGFVMLGGLSLMMASDYDVLQIEQVVLADAGGNTTGTATHTTPIITAYQTLWSYIFLGAAIIFGLIYFKVMISGAP